MVVECEHNLLSCERDCPIWKSGGNDGTSLNVAHISRLAQEQLSLTLRGGPTPPFLFFFLPSSFSFSFLFFLFNLVTSGTSIITEPPLGLV